MRERAVPAPNGTPGGDRTSQWVRACNLGGAVVVRKLRRAERHGPSPGVATPWRSRPCSAPERRGNVRSARQPEPGAHARRVPRRARPCAAPKSPIDVGAAGRCRRARDGAERCPRCRRSCPARRFSIGQEPVAVIADRFPRRAGRFTWRQGAPSVAAKSGNRDALTATAGEFVFRKLTRHEARRMGVQPHGRRYPVDSC